MPTTGWRVIVATDVVDSTRLSHTAPDACNVWADHDRVARDLIRQHGGHEIGRTDGIVALFDLATEALDFARSYHDALAALPIPLSARIGAHGGPVTLRENRPEDIRLGAVALDVDGPVLPLSMRLQALAQGGQTLVSRALLGQGRPTVDQVAHGFWQIKGFDDPVEVFEMVRPGRSALRPRDVEKAFQVERHDDAWLAVKVASARLPGLPGSFIGRQPLITEIGLRFDAGATLVTLLGAGGVGKTRLSIRFAQRGSIYFEGGVWCCDLASATDADGVLLAIARGLDIPLISTHVVQTLGHAIAGRGRCLLILDNAESAAPAVAALLPALQQVAGEACILVTSRVALGLQGESIIGVEPMEAGEAGALFERRARDAGAALSDEDRSALPLLVDALDRLPLALELAAARCAAMPPSLQLARLRARRQWLAAPATADIARRHSTMSVVFDASWSLLSRAEQSALAQCTVFEGGFGLDAAEAVVVVEGLWVGDLLAALISKSLLLRTDGSRMGLLRTVHDEALEKDETQSLRQAALVRHGRYFASLDERDVLNRDFADLDNLLAACERATRGPEARAAVDSLTLCADVLLVRGPVRRLVLLAEAVHALPGLSEGDRAETLRVLGNAMYPLGRRDEALQAYRRGLVLAASAGDRRRRIRLACALATLLATAGSAAAADELLQSVQGDVDRLGDPIRACALANAAGTVDMAARRLDHAIGNFEQALSLAQLAQHRRWEGGVRGNLGGTLYLSGRKREAQHHFETALSIAQDIGDRAWAANAQCNLGLLLLENGHHQAAEAMLSEALQSARDIGQGLLEAAAACNLGLLLIERGRAQDAIAPLHDAAALATRMADHSLAAQCERALAQALEAAGDPGAAGRALVRATGHALHADDAAEAARCWVQRAKLALHVNDTAAASRALAEARSACRHPAAQQDAALLAEIETLSRPPAT
jgi:predicted ATPase